MTSMAEEEFCARCFAGVDSSEHHEKCVVPGRAIDGESAPVPKPSMAEVIAAHQPSRWRSFTNENEILRCCKQDFGNLSKKAKRGDAEDAWRAFTEHLQAELAREGYGHVPTRREGRNEETTALDMGSPQVAGRKEQF